MTFSSKFFFAILVAIFANSVALAMYPEIHVPRNLRNVVPMQPDMMVGRGIYNANDTCGICMEALGVDVANPVIAIHCDIGRPLYHSFHANCIKMWWIEQRRVAGNLKCPICSRDSNSALPKEINIRSICARDNLFRISFFVGSLYICYLLYNISSSDRLISPYVELRNIRIAEGALTKDFDVLINAADRKIKDECFRLFKWMISAVGVLLLMILVETDWRGRDFFSSRNLQLRELFRRGGVLEFD